MTYWAVLSNEVRGPFEISDLMVLEASGDVVGGTAIKSCESNGPWTFWREIKSHDRQAAASDAITANALARPPSLLAAGATPATMLQTEMLPKPQRSVFIFLAVFLGLIGLHNFYADRIVWGVAQLLLSGIGLAAIYSGGGGDGVQIGFFFIGIVGVSLIIEIPAVKRDGAGDFMR